MSDKQYRHLPEHDQKLIEKAQNQRWEQIDEDEAWTEEARLVLHRICADKYHREEYLNGIL